MLNWRRDPGYEKSIVLHEQRMNENRIAIERSKERTKLIENEILRVRSDREQIEKEIEQLDHENAIEGALIDSIRRLCFPPESSSIPVTPTAPDCKLS